MTYIKLAIREACDNGGYLDGVASFDSHKNQYYSQVFLDPLFWQALGKARGWGTEPVVTTPSGFPVQEWLMFWHRFIDDLAEGEDAESFFKDL